MLATSEAIAARESEGWAVLDITGRPLMKTVADTRRAAIVNWLVVYAHVPIFFTTSDARIEELWSDWKEDAVAAPITCRAHGGS